MNIIRGAVARMNKIDDEFFFYVILAVVIWLISLPFVLLVIFVGRPDVTLSIKLAYLGLFVLFLVPIITVIVACVVLNLWNNGSNRKRLDPYGVDSVTVGKPTSSQGALIGCSLCPELIVPDSSGNSGWRHITMNSGLGFYVCPVHQGTDSQLISAYLIKHRRK